MTRDKHSDTLRGVRLLGLIALAALAACRFGFDPRVQSDAAVTPGPDAEADGASDVPTDAPPVLACTPARFAVGGTTVYLTAVGTRRGFAVFTVDDVDVVRGYAFQLVGNQLELVAGTGGVLPVPTSIGPVAAVALDADPSDEAELAVAVPYPLVSAAAVPAPTLTTAGGTVVVPFNGQLQRVDAPAAATMNDGLIVGPGALAGGDHGTMAYLGQGGGAVLSLQAVSRRGVATTGMVPINTNDHDVTRQTLVRTPIGYLGVWSDNSSMPHEAVIATAIDDDLVAHAPVTISVHPDHGSFVPAAAYLPRAHKYLFGWMEKPGHDFIHLSLRDEQLSPVPVSPPGPRPGELDLLMSEGTVPIIAAGDDDFLAVWPNTARSPTLLTAARVDASGKVTLGSHTNTGGEVAAFDVIARNGQPVLFWVEKNGTGPNLWIDPLCQ
jgi:hypothetical protein